MLKRPHYIALALTALLVAALLRVPAPILTRFKLAIGGLFVPLSGFASSSRQLLEKAETAVLPRHELARRNAELALKVQELELELMQRNDAWRENAELRQMLQWQHQSSWNLRAARVVAHDPANWWRSIEIDRGSRDGLRANLPVLTPDGLVGRIASVSAGRAQVLLIGDPNLRVGALVQETRETGVILATTPNPMDPDFATLAYLSRNTLVKPGQTVVTSGDGGLFPRGITIGKVVDLRPVTFGLATEARVKLAANLNTLEDVWVIVQ